MFGSIRVLAIRNLILVLRNRSRSDGAGFGLAPEVTAERRVIWSHVLHAGEFRIRDLTHNVSKPRLISLLDRLAQIENGL